MSNDNLKPSTEIGDQELMRYLDGELDDDRMRELDVLIEHNDEAQAKLAGLGAVSQLLRERADSDERGDGIADWVMTKIDSGEAEHGDDAEVIDMPLSPRLDNITTPVGGSDAPANDNSRSIFMIAGLAAAVAAGLFFWGQETPDATLAELAPGATEAPAALTAPDRASTAADRGAAVPSIAEPIADDGSDAKVVEVASVEWGSGLGQVFEVGDSASAATLVVWVNDTEGEEL